MKICFPGFFPTVGLAIEVATAMQPFITRTGIAKAFFFQQQQKKRTSVTVCRLHGHLDLDFVSLKLAWASNLSRQSISYCACKNYHGKEVDLDGCEVIASFPWNEKLAVSTQNKKWPYEKMHRNAVVCNQNIFVS